MAEKIAKITLGNSCPRRDFLIAFRNGNIVTTTILVVFLKKDCTSIIDLCISKLNLAMKL